MPKAQEIWNGLSQEERDRIAAFYDRTAREAYSYCCSILIGCPHLPAIEASSATGVFVRIDDHHYVITANHVVDSLWGKLNAKDPAHFQINQLVIDPATRTVYAHPDHDVAVLAIDSSETHRIAKQPYVPVGSWPPPLPHEGASVQLTGFAARNRRNAAPRTIESYSLHLVARVMNPRDSRFYAQVERDGVPTDNADLVPPPEDSLGGMSGGPIVLLTEGPLELVGIISEMSHLMDAVRACALSEIRIPPRSTIVGLPSV